MKRKWLVLIIIANKNLKNYYRVDLLVLPYLSEVLMKMVPSCKCLLKSLFVSECYNFRFHLDPSGTYTEYDAKAIGKLAIIS